MGSCKRVFIALIFTLSTALCFAQKPVAHFYSDCKILCFGGTTGLGNNQVGFYYNGTGGTPTSYTWTIPGGTGGILSASTTGNVTFTAVGTYLVTVKATNGSGTSSFTDTIFVINNCSANASVDLNMNTICPGTCVGFTDKSNFRPDTWSWTFPGEGIPAPGDTSYHQNPQNICYPTVGKFQVMLTASRSACFNQAQFSSQIITVKACPPVAFTINTSNNAPCKGDCINFTSHLTSGTAPFTYKWTFQSAATATSTDSLPTSICYPTIPPAGTSYTATLLVVDANGKRDSSTINITPKSCVPTANFAAPQPICASQCITFKDQSTAGSGGAVTGWTWTFTGGNISASTSENPVVCYTNAGTYTATLIASNASGSSAPVSQPVIVNSCPPTADFTFNQNNFCQGGCATFTDHSTGGAGGRITNWVWAFQDPNGSATPIIYTTDSLPPPVCYPTPGMYTVTEVVTNPSGPSTPFTQTVTVRYCPPPVIINFTTFSGNANIPNDDVCRDSCIRITNNSSGATTYFWLFISKNDSGVLDTTTYSGANPPSMPGNCFAVPGDTGFLHIILFGSSADSTKTLDELIHVHICSGMFPALKPSETSICTGTCISFTDETTEQPGTGPPVVWQWIFDGGSPDSAMVQNPPYVCYQYPGIYPVKLKVLNAAGAKDSVTYNSLITVNEPVPVSTSFDSTVLILGNSEPLFATGGVSYLWSPSTYLDVPSSSNPIFTPIDTGIFKLTVQMTDVNGCSSTKTIVVNVIPPDLVRVPNIFTPNGDGVNDYFDIFISGPYQFMELHIYDRWGELIYSTNSPANNSQTTGWNGSYKGRMVGDGVYVYYYNVIFKDGTVLKNAGDITMLK